MTDGWYLIDGGFGEGGLKHYDNQTIRPSAPKNHQIPTATVRLDDQTTSSPDHHKQNLVHGGRNNSLIALSPDLLPR